MHLHSGVQIAFFVIMALIVGALVRGWLKKSALPYSVALLLLGIATGLAVRYVLFEGLAVGDLPADFAQHLHLASADHVGWQSLVQSIGALFFDGIMLMSTVDPHLILFLFLPILIFESAFGMESHLFWLSFTQISWLAIPGLLFAVFATAFLVSFMLPWEWSWSMCLLFGALISATDPVAVVALLKEVSSRKRLETLIEGESLFNDGTAIVLFTLFLGMVTGGQSGGIAAGTVEFIWVVMAGAGVGLLVALLALYWFDRIFNDPMVEISISIACAYLVFFVAENLLHVSGVVAVVTLALIFAGPGRTRISVEVADFLHHFWEMMAHMANTLIFLLVGLIVAMRIRLDVLDWWWMLLLLYVGITVIRASSVFIFMPVLARLGLGITREKAIVLIWGGLRGAVALALALTVANNPNIPREIGEQVLFLAAGIVVLTILINGTTMGRLLKALGLDGLPKAKLATVAKAKHKVKLALDEEISLMKQEPLLARANWQELENLIELDEDSKRALRSGDISSQQQDEEGVAYQRRLLETERKFYWNQYKSGALGQQAVTHLVNAVEKCLDGQPQISHRPSLFKLWEPPKLLTLISRLPRLNRLLLSLSYAQMSLGYEIALGFIAAQEAALLNAQQLAPNLELAEQARSAFTENRQLAMARIDSLQRTFPEVAYSLETQTAHRLMLNRERALIKGLVKDAQLEKSEADKMISDVENRLEALAHMPKFTTSSDFKSHFEKVPWLSACSEQTLETLCAHAQRRIHVQGEVLCKENAAADSIAIVCRGQIRSDGETEDGEGLCIGLEGVLTSHYAHRVEAASPCDLIWINIAALRDLMAQQPQLAQSISALIQRRMAP